MRASSLPPRKRAVASAIGILFAALAIQSHAATTVVDGRTLTVSAPGDPTTSWQVINNGTLNLTNGVATNSVLVGGSLAGQAASAGTFNADGATITSTAGNSSTAGVEVRDSVATISNSTITSTIGNGVLVSGLIGGPLPKSVVTITNSTISGIQYGVGAAPGATVTLNNTTVTETAPGAGGLDGGVANIDATVVINGGAINGISAGILASTERQSTPLTSTTTLNNVSVSASAGPAILVQPARAAAAFENHVADLLIENGTTLSGSNGYALQAIGLITANATIDNSNIVGNMSGDGTATVNLTLQNKAMLTGALTNITSLAVNSNATWRLTGDSNVASASMGGGTIDISGTAAGTGVYHTLTLGSLSGNGTFLMGTNLGAHTGDLLSVTGSATGAYELNVTNTGVQPANLSPLTVVHTGGGGATFSVAGGKVDAGVYSYTLQQQGNDWALATDPGNSNDLSPSADVVLGISGAAPTIWYGEASVLRSRMGELRFDDQSNSGVWARTFGKQFNAKPTDGANYRQTQYGVIGGVDGVVGEAWGGKWLVGAMMGTSHSKLSFDNGSTGGVNSYTAGLYATWLAATGWYFDGVIKYNHFQNDADAIMSNGVAAHGSFGNNGIGMTLEFGRHLEFGDHWFVEPYAQLSMLRVGGDDFSLSNGMTSNTPHTGSVEARIGAAMGKSFNLPGGGKLQPYVKIAVVQEFVKSNQINVNGIGFNNDLSGTRAEFGAGVAGQLRRNFQVYAEVETGVGRRVSQPWGGQIGLRYTF